MTSRNVKFIYVAAAVAVAMIGGWLLWLRDVQPKLVFFDVGQGDAALVQHGRLEALIDGGPDRTVLAKLGRELPYFDRHVEIVVLTHPHDDHLSGLVAIAERYRIGRLFLTARAAAAPETAELRRLVRTSGGTVEVPQVGDVIWLDAQLALQVLWSGSADLDDWNDDSLMLRILSLPPPENFNEKYQSSALLTGDISSVVEKRLITSDSPLASSVLKVGHHGSRHSTSIEWLEAVQPTTAVVSVGRNSYGHPAAIILRRLTSHGSVIHRTDQRGDARFTLPIRSGELP